MTGRRATRWQYLGPWLVIGFGVVIGLAALPATSTPAVLLTDLVFWPIDGAQSLTQEARLLSAIVGGVMVGWGVTLVLLTQKVYPREPDLVSTVIRGGVWAWFVVDSIGSIAVGSPVNVVLNIGFLLVFVLPWRRVATAA
ncbi:MAG: hypothetical protein M3094_04040 [Actinomycetia bacterium]|nr:hypothetical protein [Actinomycetes bacterium]